MIRKNIIVFSIILLLISSALFYYTSKMSDPKVSLDSYYTRKEDLYASQQKIEKMLFDLNQTIKEETENQKILLEKVKEVSAKADLPPPVINTTKVIQEPDVIINTPVTRAS